MFDQHTIIGIDPDKRSHTAVILDDHEEFTAQIRVDAGPDQVQRLLAWAAIGSWVWAVENTNGTGRLLSQQLVAAGEIVVDVPATLTARTRLLSGKSGTKTEAHDARSVVIAARRHTALRRAWLTIQRSNSDCCCNIVVS